MAQASAKYLPHFHADGQGRLRPADAGRGTVQPGDRPVAEIAAEAEAKGRRAAEEAARVELERRRAEDREAFARELAAARREWAEATADRLAADMAAKLDGLRDTVVDGVARALAPFLGDRVRERALAALADTVAALLRDGRHVRIRVSGPADLLDALRPKIAAPAVDWVASDLPDVTVTFDDTTVETRIGAWTSLVAAAIAGSPDG
ncbi:MAG TPA: hypothetical protein PKA74_08560 [Bauldia sp.]|nr:hypothetical protein [Bauldia sp.]